MLDPTLPFQSNFKDVRVNCRFELPTRKPYMYSALPVCWLATVCGAFVIATYELSRIDRVQVSPGMPRYDDQLLSNLHVTFLYMMTYLGGWFHKSSLYDDMLPYLSDPSNARVINLGEKFVSRFEQLVGNHNLMYNTEQILISRMHAFLSGPLTAGKEVDYCASVISNATLSVPTKDREKIYRFLQNSMENANSQGIKEARARAVHLGASFFIGYRFYEDPLFPWIIDLSKNNNSPDIKAFMMFSIKRLEKNKRLREAKIA